MPSGAQAVPQGRVASAHNAFDEAASRLKDSGPRWLTADGVERKRHLSLVVQKIWVKDDQVSAIMLRPNFYDLGRQASNTRTTEDGQVRIEVRPSTEDDAERGSNASADATLSDNADESGRCGFDHVEPDIILVVKNPQIRKKKAAT